MTLQQLRYLVAVAEYGSFNAAAQRLYTTQSNISKQIDAFERDTGVKVFERSRRGVSITNEGTELLGYARLVLEQADLFDSRFSGQGKARTRLAVSAQHYAFSVKAFVDTVGDCDDDEYEFIMRECGTAQIIDDVRTFRSDIGILYLDRFNSVALKRAFADAGLTFHPLFSAGIHVFVGKHHPLADRERIFPDELDEYPRYSFEQGSDNSLYYSEEPLGQLHHSKNIRISDRGTLTNLLTSHKGYTLSTGVLSGEMHSGIVSIPLCSDEVMHVGYVIHAERKPSALLQRYIAVLDSIVFDNPTPPEVRQPRDDR